MRLTFLPLVPLVLVAQSPELRLQRDVALLASEGMKGRGNGSPELVRAAAFVARRHRALGLRPATTSFPFPARVEVVSARAAWGPTAWLPGRDFQPLGASGEGTLEGKALTFLGYGTKSGAYDEFRGLDLKDRVAIIRRRIPDLPFLAHLSPVERGLTYRLRRLQEAGAAAVRVLE